MAVAAAEQTFIESNPLLETIPLVSAVPELIEDEFARHRAERFIGACALDSEVELSLKETALAVSPIESLHDAIHLAAEGNIEARNMVKTNVMTDVVERTIKTGHVIKVDLHVDVAGKIQQHGQSMESVQANSLRMAADSWQMRQRTEAEATNSFRIEQLHRQGTLQDYSFVVFSRAADNMSKEQMDDAGFFTETMSCAIQVTSATGNTLSTESAFVSGIKRAGGERHDAETIVATAERLGVDLSGKGAAEVLSTPLLVHNSLLENGAIDLVEIYDDCAGGTFFGEDRPVENYCDYREKCVDRETMLQPKVDSIVEELITNTNRITGRIAAVKRLHELSERHMVEHAIGDSEINPLVFGEAAAAHINEARFQLQQGNYGQVLAAASRAKSTAVSSSCPSALKSSTNIEDGPDSKDSDNPEDCEFISKQCPECGEKNVKTRVTKNRITGSCGCSKSK
jgi:hypothetical protein